MNRQICPQPSRSWHWQRGCAPALIDGKKGAVMMANFSQLMNARWLRRLDTHSNWPLPCIDTGKEAPCRDTSTIAIGAVPARA
jgi:hypothetical protein